MKRDEVGRMKEGKKRREKRFNSIEHDIIYNISYISLYDIYNMHEIMRMREKMV